MTITNPIAVPVDDMVKLEACAKREGTEGAIARVLVQLVREFVTAAPEKSTPIPSEASIAVAAAIEAAPAFFEEMRRQNQLKRTQMQAIIQKARDAVYAAQAEAPVDTTWQLVPRDSRQINKPLHDLICSLIGTPLEKFLKYDPERKVVDYSANMAHLSMVVDLTEFMGIPGSGFEFAWYYSRSDAAARLQKAKKVLAAAIEEMHLLGGPGLAPDSAVQAFYEARERVVAAEAALLPYSPEMVPVKA